MLGFLYLLLLLLALKGGSSSSASKKKAPGKGKRTTTRSEAAAADDEEAHSVEEDESSTSETTDASSSGTQKFGSSRVRDSYLVNKAMKAQIAAAKAEWAKEERDSKGEESSSWIRAKLEGLGKFFRWWLSRWGKTAGYFKCAENPCECKAHLKWACPDDLSDEDLIAAGRKEDPLLVTRGFYVEVIGEHSCSPQNSTSARKTIAAELKEKFQADPSFTPRQAYLEQLKPGAEGEFEIPTHSLNQLKCLSYSVRKPGEVLPMLDDIINVTYKHYPHFLRRCSLAPLIMLMISEPCLELLRSVGNDAIIYMDGTFSIAWPGYVMIGFFLYLNGVVVPTFNAIVDKTDEANICRVLSDIKNVIGIGWSPKVIVLDFERAFWNALAVHFPQAVLFGCEFHLLQAVQGWMYKHQDDKGLDIKTRKAIIHDLAEMARQPTKILFDAAMEDFQGKYFKSCPTFAKYFKSFWLDQIGSGGWAGFKLHEVVKESPDLVSIPKTNNFSEGAGWSVFKPMRETVESLIRNVSKQKLNTLVEALAPFSVERCTYAKLAEAGRKKQLTVLDLPPEEVQDFQISVKLGVDIRHNPEDTSDSGPSKDDQPRFSTEDHVKKMRKMEEKETKRKKSGKPVRSVGAGTTLTTEMNSVSPSPSPSPSSSSSLNDLSTSSVSERAADSATGTADPGSSSASGSSNHVACRSGSGSSSESGSGSGSCSSSGSAAATVRTRSQSVASKSDAVTEKQNESGSGRRRRGFTANLEGVSQSKQFLAVGLPAPTRKKSNTTKQTSTISATEPSTADEPTKSIPGESSQPTDSTSPGAEDPCTIDDLTATHQHPEGESSSDLPEIVNLCLSSDCDSEPADDNADSFVKVPSPICIGSSPILINSDSEVERESVPADKIPSPGIAQIVQEEPNETDEDSGDDWYCFPGVYIPLTRGAFFKNFHVVSCHNNCHLNQFISNMGASILEFPEVAADLISDFIDPDTDRGIRLHANRFFADFHDSSMSKTYFDLLELVRLSFELEGALHSFNRLGFEIGALVDPADWYHFLLQGDNQHPNPFFDWFWFTGFINPARDPNCVMRDQHWLSQSITSVWGAVTFKRPRPSYIITQIRLRNLFSAPHWFNGGHFSITLGLRPDEDAFPEEFTLTGFGIYFPEGSHYISLFYVSGKGWFRQDGLCNNGYPSRVLNPWSFLFETNKGRCGETIFCYFTENRRTNELPSERFREFVKQVRDAPWSGYSHRRFLSD